MVKDKIAVKNDILRELAHSTSSMHMTKLAKMLNVSIPTLSKYCHILEAEKKVVIEEVGKSKIVRLAN
jgi:predicted transcriptional regulator